MLPALRRRLGGLVSLGGTFRSERSGMAAVEFAIALPVLTVLFYGLLEVGTAVSIDRKLTLLARSLADLSSRDDEMTSDKVKSVFDASGAVMRPYDQTKTQMVISSLLITQVGSTYTSTVLWSCGRNALPATETDATKRANNLTVRPIASTTFAVPAGFQNGSSKSFILTETLYPYDSPFVTFFKVTRRLRKSTPWPARNGDKVVGPIPTSCPA